jgi:hypothetical protein
LLSSLTTVLSSALVCSTRPPESVCGTVTGCARLEVFLGSMGSATSRKPKQSLDITSRPDETVDLPAVSAYGLIPGHPTPGWPTLLRHPIAQTYNWWCRNINLLSIAYAFRPQLRNRLTLRRLTLPRKPWTHGERVFNPLYRYSCLHNRFQNLHASLSVALQRQLECSSTAPACARARSFGVMLKPRYIFGAGSLDQ